MKRATAVLLALTLAGLAGCAHSDKEGYHDSPFISANYRAADQLLEQLHSRLPAGHGNTLLVATLVNIDELERSSTLGRLASEQVSARFTQAGYQMVEMKFRNGVYMLQNQGELMLTRKIHELAREHAAQAVVVGTYGESREHVFLNVKVIQPHTNMILAVHDYTLPLDNNVRSMLRNRRY